MDAKNRVLVIGLDGATLDVIKPMVCAGKLPNFARLMRKGAYGPLKSTIPPITPCAWTSFATGKDPSKHGLYDFILHEGDPEKKKSVNRTLIKAKSLWKILSEAGKKSIVIDVPLTYPPEGINGILISRVMAPPKKNCVFPKSLYYTLRKKGFIKKIERKVAEEHGADNANREEVKKRPKRLSKAKLKKMSRERIEKTFKHMIEEIDKNIKLAEWLIEKEDWDFFMIVFMSPDHAGHGFWRKQTKVKKIYEKLDEAIGKLFQFAGEDTTEFIMSDHGFISIPHSFNINEWLYAKGFLFKKVDIPRKESMREIKELLRRLRKKRLKRLSGQSENMLKKFRCLIRTDYSKSKAYLQSGTSYGVRINLEGRDKTGIVKKENYEALRDHLIEEFKKIRHPMTGKKIFSQILRKEDVYSQSSSGMDPAPDIFLLSPDMNVMLEGQFTRPAKVFKKTSEGYGFHHINGIFFAQGKGVKNLSLNSPRITDLAPTILHILNVPVPRDMDGRILKEIFDKDSSLAKRKIQYQAPSVIGKQEEKVYSKREEEELRARLRALGYV